jgi:hypothetical protein
MYLFKDVVSSGFAQIILDMKCNEVRYLYGIISLMSRSQWPRGLRHELSSLARTLGSWVRIPLKARMSVLCVCVWGGGARSNKGCRAIIIISLMLHANLYFSLCYTCVASPHLTDTGIRQPDSSNVEAKIWQM